MMSYLHTKAVTSFHEVPDQKVRNGCHHALQQDEEVVHMVKGRRVVLALNGHFGQGGSHTRTGEDDSLSNYQYEE